MNDAPDRVAQIILNATKPKARPLRKKAVTTMSKA
jgi:hypothetical protein